MCCSVYMYLCMTTHTQYERRKFLKNKYATQPAQATTSVVENVHSMEHASGWEDFDPIQVEAARAVAASTNFWMGMSSGQLLQKHNWWHSRL